MNTIQAFIKSDETKHQDTKIVVTLENGAVPPNRYNYFSVLTEKNYALCKYKTSQFSDC